MLFSLRQVENYLIVFVALWLIFTTLFSVLTMCMIYYNSEEMVKIRTFKVAQVQQAKISQDLMYAMELLNSSAKLQISFDNFVQLHNTTMNHIVQRLETFIAAQKGLLSQMKTFSTSCANNGIKSTEEVGWFFQNLKSQHEVVLKINATAILDKTIENELQILSLALDSFLDSMSNTVHKVQHVEEHIKNLKQNGICLLDDDDDDKKFSTKSQSISQFKFIEVLVELKEYFVQLELSEEMRKTNPFDPITTQKQITQGQLQISNLLKHNKSILKQYVRIVNGDTLLLKNNYLEILKLNRNKWEHVKGLFQELKSIETIKVLENLIIKHCLGFDEDLQLSDHSVYILI